MQIPIIQQVDVLVVGGATGAVECAVAAKRSGAAVFLAASMNYLGDDMCATARLHPEPGTVARSPAARRVFGDAAQTASCYRPMQIKNRLSLALVESGIDFRFGAHPTDVLVNAQGLPAGVVFASRSGRWAVTAGIIVDCSLRALAARRAGNPFRAYPAGPRKFERTVIGGDPVPGLEVRQLPCTVAVTHEGATLSWPVYEYSLNIDMADGAIAAFENAEVQARKATWSTGQVAAADMLFHIPPDTLRSRAPFAGQWPGAEQLPVDALTADGRTFVLGPCADLPAPAAEKMLAPLEFMALGKRLGEHAAACSRRLQAPKACAAAEFTQPADGRGEARELQPGYRPMPTDVRTIDLETAAVPPLADVEVAVAGGGTGGAPAALTAAREGRSTLVLEALGQLGGVGTVGLIGRYYHGFRGGFTEQIDAGVDTLVADPANVKPDHDVEAKQFWFAREIDAAGGRIWYHALCYGALVESDRVTGLFVATPYGHGLVTSTVAVDATGNADVAAAAGAQCITVGPDDVAVQGTGLSPRTPGVNYTNRDHTFIDDSDLLDTWRALIGTQAKYEERFDLAPIVNSRQRRQIVGDFSVSPLDIILGRTYPDTIITALSNFDSHGYTVHPVFELTPPDREQLHANLPYRCLLPRGLKGILVLGLGIGAHRDAMPILRMQPDIQNQGFAAGLAAAQAVQQNGDTRAVDMRELQRRLVDAGVIEPDAAGCPDAFPLPDAAFEQAVRTVTDNWRGVAVLLSDPARALPLVRDAFEHATVPEDALTYARILAVLGDGRGAAALAQAVREADWDDGWNYTGMGQFGRSMSPVDDLVVALGRTGKASTALEPVLAKARALDAASAFSHFRAVARACEMLGNEAAAPVLAALLRKPGVMGHALLSIKDVLDDLAGDWNDTTLRNAALRELVTARALYRCGDSQGLGKQVLETYSRDVRAHFAAHARSVLGSDDKLSTDAV